MPKTNTTKNREDASVSRRKFMAIAAASAAATLPAVALAEVSGKTSRVPQPSELPIDHFDRLSVEMSKVLSDYLDGRFYACVYPAKVRDGFEQLNGMVILKSISAEAYHAPLEKRFEMAVRNLREVVQEMHPDCDEVTARSVYGPDEPGMCVIVNARSLGVRCQTGGAL